MFYNENERILNFCFLEKHTDLFQVVAFRINDYLYLKRRKCLAKKIPRKVLHDLP